MSPGETIDGKEFDSSFKRGKPTSFAPNQVTALGSNRPCRIPRCSSNSECRNSLSLCEPANDRYIRTVSQT